MVGVASAFTDDNGPLYRVRMDVALTVVLSTGKGGDSNPALWSVFAVACIPAVAAIIAAVIAARSASHARASQREADRVRLLEDRVSGKKQEVYQPMIDFLGAALDKRTSSKIPTDEYADRLSQFSRWVVIVGSDEAVRAFHNLMQATYAGAPAPLLLRLFADFQIAARRDMGDPDTEVTALEVMGMRVNDLYTGDPTLKTLMTVPFEEACQRQGWKIPWLDGDPSDDDENASDESR